MTYLAWPGECQQTRDAIVSSADLERCQQPLRPDVVPPWQKVLVSGGNYDCPGGIQVQIDLAATEGLQVTDTAIQPLSDCTGGNRRMRNAAQHSPNCRSNS